VITYITRPIYPCVYKKTVTFKFTHWV